LQNGENFQFHKPNDVNYLNSMFPQGFSSEEKYAFNKEYITI